MPTLRLLRSRTRLLAPAALGLALFASACSGGDTSTTISDAVAAAEAASQSSTSSDQAGAAPTSSNGSQNDGDSESDADRFAAIAESSTHFAETTAGTSRVMIGVNCLQGYSTPTATVTIQASGLPTGTHEGAVTPATGGRPTLRVFEEDVQDLPAGSAYSARQTGFEADEYEFVWEALGITLAVPGC